MNIPIEVDLRLSQIKSTIEKIVVTAKTGNPSPEELIEYLSYVKALKQEYRIVRGEYDLLYFAYEYFSERYNPENKDNLIPIKYSLDDAPEFHRELGEILDTLNDNITQKICWSVPRGHGKSAYLSNVFPIHQIVYGKRHYIIIVSETESMSRKFTEWISEQLKFNNKIRDDFQSLLSPNKMSNDTDNIEGFVTATDIRVQSASIGKQLRGARHKSHRPDLVILDDLESSKNTNTRELREKNLHWFNSVIMPIGDITKTAFVYMGTLVHGGGLLPSVMNRSDFRGKLYSAIVSYPENTELWEKLEELLRDVANPEREHDAEVLYYANQEAYDLGAVTLWMDRFSYFDLMKIKVNVGSKAFGSEYLNKPTDEDSAVFRESLFQYYVNSDLQDLQGRPLNLELYSFWDIAIGRTERADYNAIITLGRDTRTGILYVVDTWIQKCPMHIALQEAYRIAQEFRPKFFGVESIQAQYEMYRQLQEMVTKAGLYSTRVKPINPKQRKEERIETLEPLIEQGILRFKKTQRLLLEQLVGYPNADNDDAPDALASCVELAGTQRKRSYYKKPVGF